MSNDFHHNMKLDNFENLMFWIGKYAKKVGRVTARPIILTYYVMMDDRTPMSDKMALGTAIAYVVLPIDLLSAKRLPIIGWLDEVMSLSVAYQKVQSHVTKEMERKADELLDEWFPEYTPFTEIP